MNRQQTPSDCKITSNQMAGRAAAHSRTSQENTWICQNICLHAAPNSCSIWHMFKTFLHHQTDRPKQHGVQRSYLAKLHHLQTSPASKTLTSTKPSSCIGIHKYPFPPVCWEKPLKCCCRPLPNQPHCSFPLAYDTPHAVSHTAGCV